MSVILISSSLGFSIGEFMGVSDEFTNNLLDNSIGMHEESTLKSYFTNDVIYCMLLLVSMSFAFSYYSSSKNNEYWLTFKQKFFRKSLTSMLILVCFMLGIFSLTFSVSTTFVIDSVINEFGNEYGITQHHMQFLYYFPVLVNVIIFLIPYPFKYALLKIKTLN